MNKFILFFTITLLLSTSIYYSMLGSNENLGRDLIFKAQIHDTEKQCTLDASFLKYAYEHNQTLKSSDPECFEPAFIKNPQKSLQKLKELGGITLTISGKTSPDIHCTFFNRNSDTLLVLGTGFPVQRERMLPFVKIFPTYDLLLFDYRGIGYDYHINKSSSFLPWKLKGLLSWKISKVDINVSRLGTLEEDEVIDAIDACNQQKHYVNVFGLGLCFSSYVFAKAAVKKPNLFNKLIFDGSWPSLERVIKSIIRDPSLLYSVENPHSVIPRITHQQWIQHCGMKLIEWLMWTNLHTQPLSYYLWQINCPVMFFQSLNDCYCNAEEFAILWDAVKTPKAAIFTQNLHGRNHVWQAEVYKEIAQAFLELSFNDFLELS